MNIKFDNNVDWVKVASVAGTALSVGAVLVSSWAQQKTTDKTIAEEVEKAVANLKK